MNTKLITLILAVTSSH